MKKICRSICSVLIKQLIIGYTLSIKACILLVFVCALILIKLM